MKKKFYRISDEQMEALAVYMDSDIREEVRFRFAPCTNEEVHNRFAPCTNEELLGQVLARNGIAEVQIEEVLNRTFDDVRETIAIINYIKWYMTCFNYIHMAKIRFPGRNFVAEDSAEGEEYRFYLNQFSGYEKILNDLNQGSFVLTDFKNSFPEIDVVFTEDRLFYTWIGKII